MSAQRTPLDRAGELIYDWNPTGAVASGTAAVVDETLRDGLQNPSVVDPPIGEKIRILHLMEALGIDNVNVGLPGSGVRAFDDALRLCQEAAKGPLKLGISAAGRTLSSDITPILDIAQRTGLAIEACVFIGSSPIRQYVEQWDLALIARRSAEAVALAARAGLPVSFVTEDTTRSRPDVLSTLFRAAIDHGATRLVLTDTVGHATPEGVRRLIRFARGIIDAAGAPVGIDWHGHNDRGLALANALAAVEHGADRVHGTALGIGERTGNAPMELLLLNLRLLGRIGLDRDLTRLIEYCEMVAAALAWEIPSNYPLVGRDAFRTATGVHAAAVVKALQADDAWLADRVYSGVPAGTFGRQQEIAVGFMSGASNAVHWLREHRIEPTEARVARILARAKSKRQVLTDAEILAAIDAGE